jgi:hypothetical protein
LSAQDKKKEVIALSDVFIKAFRASVRDSVIEFADKIIQDDSEYFNDTTLIDNYPLLRILEMKLGKPVPRNRENKILIKKKLIFKNCEFWERKPLETDLVQVGLLMRNFLFRQDVEFDDCAFKDHTGKKAGWFGFFGCHFEKGLVMKDDYCDIMEFNECKINETFDIRPEYIGKSLVINRSEFRFVHQIDSASQLGKNGKLLYEASFVIDNNFHIGHNPFTVEIKNSVISSRNDGFQMKIEGHYKSVFIEDDTLNIAVNMTNIFIDEKVVLTDNVFKSYFGFNNSLLPATTLNTILYWNQLNGFKLVTFKDSDLGKQDYTAEIYSATDTTELRDWKSFENFINSYATLMAIYKSRSDLESANACYIEMKTIQTRRLWYLYRSHRTINNFFKLQINQFLEYFCDYGTNPVKSINFSIAVVLFFSLLYSLFPSETDNLYIVKIRWKLMEIIAYFSSQDLVPDLNRQKAYNEFDNLEKFKNLLDKTKHETPRYFRWFGVPFFYISRSYFWILAYYGSLQELRPNSWAFRTRKRKVLGAIKVTAHFGLFIFAGIFMRFFNALALSLNAFATLGYGEIEAQGVARYLAVFEGLIGWFLLSIFSVSLISQILQA